MYVEESESIADWSHEAFGTVPEADAFVCGNPASVDGMSDSLRALAGDPDGVFVLDPGNLAGDPGSALRDCTDALGALDALDIPAPVRAEATALGNCCAGYYVTAGDTGGADALRKFLAEQERQ